MTRKKQRIKVLEARVAKLEKRAERLQWWLMQNERLLSRLMTMQAERPFCPRVLTVIGEPSFDCDDADSDG